MSMTPPHPLTRFVVLALRADQYAGASGFTAVSAAADLSRDRRNPHEILYLVDLLVSLEVPCFKGPKTLSAPR
jgi:hypothetical protein